MPGGLSLAVCEERGAAEDTPLQEEVLVTFTFPDGSVEEHIFMLGQTVEVLKAHIAAEYRIEMQWLSLLHGDKHMMDPLSLSDFGAQKTGSLAVDVQIEGDRSWKREGKRK